MLWDELCRLLKPTALRASVFSLEIVESAFESEYLNPLVITSLFLCYGMNYVGY